MLEKQVNQHSEEFDLADSTKYPHARNRNAVAEHLKQAVVVEIHFGTTNYSIKPSTEKSDHLVYHRLALELFEVSTRRLRRCLAVFRRKRRE
jgi:hypothetical protein